MADISSFLEKILAAVYGEEVRSSIHDALAAMNEEAMEAVDIAYLSKESAYASANAAKASEESSALHEEAAELSANNASQSEAAARLSEENTAKSLAEAQASAGAAKDSEATAKELADAAKASQDAAEQSALNSAASEKNANQSELNAADSATKAKQEHDDYSQWVSEQETAFLAWFDQLKAQFGDDAIGSMTKLIERECIRQVLLNGFADGTKEISDDGCMISSTDSNGNTLVKTFTDNFQTVTVVLSDSQGDTVATLVKKYNSDGSSASSDLTYS